MINAILEFLQLGVLLVMARTLYHCCKPPIDPPCPPPDDDDKQDGYFTEWTVKEDLKTIYKLKGKLKIMGLTLTDTQQADGVIEFVDKKGALTDAASVEVSTSDPTVATASYDDPSNTVTVVAGLPGVAALTIVAKQADGDVLPFEDVAIEVTSGDAVSGTITFGPPTEQA